MKIKNILLTALTSVTLLSACDKEAVKSYQGTYKGYPVQITECVGYNQINIFDKTRTDSLFAKDYDKDGFYDEINTRSVNFNPELKSLANQEALAKITSNVNYAAEYPEIKKMWNERFKFQHDTVIIHEFNHTYGLSDLNNDGSFDISEYYGSTPGAYNLSIKEGSLDDFLKSDKDFEKMLNYILD